MPRISKFSESEKRGAVKRVEGGKVTQIKMAALLGVHVTTLIKWRRVYGNGVNLQGRNRKQ